MHGLRGVARGHEASHDPHRARDRLVQDLRPLPVSEATITLTRPSELLLFRERLLLGHRHRVRC